MDKRDVPGNESRNSKDGIGKDGRAGNSTFPPGVGCDHNGEEIEFKRGRERWRSSRRLTNCLDRSALPRRKARAGPWLASRGDGSPRSKWNRMGGFRCPLGDARANVGVSAAPSRASVAIPVSYYSRAFLKVTGIPSYSSSLLGPIYILEAKRTLKSTPFLFLLSF